MKTEPVDLSRKRIFEPIPGYKWQMGDSIQKDWHKRLGPCPDCGSSTFDYGGGWRCEAYNCWKGVGNMAPSVGPRPDWWYQNINVFKDGNAWCATFDDFTNIQESTVGFGSTPDEAVTELKAADALIAELNKTEG